MSIEINGSDGQLPRGKVVIVASRYNPRICDALVRGAQETLASAGYAQSDTPVVRVPGAWELPLILKEVIGQGDVVAAIAIGCVIKGETTHDEHINRAVSLAVMEISVASNVPIALGLLTCNTLEQAIHRSGGNVGNKGVESAEALLELLRVVGKVRAGI